MKNKIINTRTCFLLLAIVLTKIGQLFPAQKVEAQIVPDRTLGAESSTIRSVDDLKDAIEGGAIRGDNLFHSFREFNIGEGVIGYFY